MKVSVCLASYNGEKYIKEQIESILLQLSSYDELIISDDGSTDKTIEIIEAINDKRIILLNHKKKQGKHGLESVSANFENALKQSTGEFIFLSDQDDVWNVNKVETCVEALKNNDLVLHDCEIVNEHMQILMPSYFVFNSSKKGIIRNMFKNSYLGCCMAFRRNIVEYVMPFANRQIPHDIWLGLNAELRGNVNFMRESLLKYRRHEQNLSFSGQKSRNSLIFKIKYRLKILLAFIQHNYL